MLFVVAEKSMWESHKGIPQAEVARTWLAQLLVLLTIRVSKAEREKFSNDLTALKSYFNSFCTGFI